SVGRRNFLKTTLAAAATTTLALPRQSHAQSGTLVVTSYGGPWEQFMRDTIVPAYEKEHPGSKVELAIGLSKDWVAKMKAAGKAKAPYDMVICKEVYGAPPRAEGFYTTLPADKVPNLAQVAPNLRIKDGSGVLALVGPIGFAYRTDKIQTVPKAWK